MSCEGRAPPQCCLGSSLAAAGSGAGGPGQGSRGRRSERGWRRARALPGAGVRLGSALLGWALLGSARPGAAAAPGLLLPGEPLPLDSAQKGAAVRLGCCGKGTWARAGAGLGHS